VAVLSIQISQGSVVTLLGEVEFLTHTCNKFIFLEIRQ